MTQSSTFTYQFFPFLIITALSELILVLHHSTRKIICILGYRRIQIPQLYCRFLFWSLTSCLSFLMHQIYNVICNFLRYDFRYINFHSIQFFIKRYSRYTSIYYIWQFDSSRRERMLSIILCSCITHPRMIWLYAEHRIKLLFKIIFLVIPSRESHHDGNSLYQLLNQSALVP